jgi:tetratricopeptide (TPR) repeat protein
VDYRDYGRIWRDTVEKRPENARARSNYATELLAEGRHAEATEHLRAAVALAPRSAEFQANLGVALCMSRAFEECFERLEQAIAIDPRYAPAYRDLAEAHASNGRHAPAVDNYVRAITLNPDDVFLLNRAGWLLATSTEESVRNGAYALQLAQRAVALTNRRDVTSLDTLAAALAESGRFDEAANTALEARKIAAATGPPAAVEEMDGRIDRYRARQPIREAPLAPGQPSR